MACDPIAGLKVVQVVMCLVCLMYKLWTVWETLRVFYELEKQSREWPLSRRLAVDRTGSIFSDIVLGSYVIVTAGLLVGHAKGETARARTTEGFFLVLGAILFLIVGGVSITSIDDVPDKLVDNGIILGILTIITAILFLLDIGLTRKQPVLADFKTKKPVKTQQKELPRRVDPKPTRAEKIDEEDKDKGKKKSVFQELKSSLKRRSQDGEVNHRDSARDVRTVEFQERAYRENESQKRSNGGRSPQVGRRNLENRGFSRQYDDDGTSTRPVDPGEFERSFGKVGKPENGYIKNEDRQTASTLRDDERFRSGNGDDYRKRDEKVESSRRPEEYYSERSTVAHRQPNGHIRGEDKVASEREERLRPNGFARHKSIDEVDYSRRPGEMETTVYRPPTANDSRTEDLDAGRKQRRHSIDYVDKDERVSPMRSEDLSRRSREYEKRSTASVEASPRFYSRDTAEDIYRKSQDGYRHEDLRRPEYVEDRRSYKGYADTVKYLEETWSEKHARHGDDDSAMPPKHVMEVELDDHFYRPADQKSQRRGYEGGDTLQVAKVSSSQRSENNNSSDDGELIPQITSVSVLLSERGRKIMPSVSASPVERVGVATPKYYFADPSPSPSSPGYVKQTASRWPSPTPVPPKGQ